jgi:cytochrome c556
MRIVTLFSAAGLAAVLYAGFASAQQNPIEERRNMMKTNGRHSALISKMVKGEEAYDAAKVKQAFDDWEATQEVWLAIPGEFERRRHARIAGGLDQQS